MDALFYKIHNDPYYQDFRVDYNAVEESPKNATYISHMLNYGLSMWVKSNIYIYTYLEYICKKRTWNLNYL